MERNSPTQSSNRAAPCTTLDDPKIQKLEARIELLISIKASDSQILPLIAEKNKILQTYLNNLQNEHVEWRLSSLNKQINLLSETEIKHHALSEISKLKDDMSQISVEMTRVQNYKGRVEDSVRETLSRIRRLTKSTNNELCRLGEEALVRSQRNHQLIWEALENTRKRIAELEVANYPCCPDHAVATLPAIQSKIKLLDKSAKNP